MGARGSRAMWREILPPWQELRLPYGQLHNRERNSEIYREYMAGASMADLARKHHMNPHGIRVIVKGYGTRINKEVSDRQEESHNTH